jgi:glutaredoxin
VSDPARIVLVLAVAALALVLAWWFRTRANRSGEPIDVSGLRSDAGVVIFTKDDCPSCVTTLGLLEAVAVPVRQVRAEEEPEAFEARRVTGVPVTVIVDGSGRSIAQFAGVPRARALERAIGRALEIPNARPREL